MQCPTRNNFCYVCGLFAPRKKLKNITKTVVNSFQRIFKTAYVPYLWYIFQWSANKKIVASYEFSSKLNAIEQRAWKGTVAVIEQFLGNNRAANYKNIVAEMISAY